MLLAHRFVEIIDSILKTMIEDGFIINYRISFKFNMQVESIIFIEDSLEKKDVATQFENRLNKELEKNFSVRFDLNSFKTKYLNRFDIEEDDFYNYLLDKKSKKITNLRRRYENLLDDLKLGESELKTPVITFYSYKGGVGRTTALCTFAAHYAMNHGKTVVALDCDFEAPGITNVFGLGTDLDNTENAATELVSKNGIIEYLLDSQFLDKEPQNFDSYIYTISNYYSGKGKIYLMPSGNLSSQPVNDLTFNTHLHDYLDGLSRINISNPEQIKEQFTRLLKRIKYELNPDVILIDSRTGFSDVFANIGLTLSDMIIGLFGDNYQTEPGINFFLSSGATSQTDKILVNSISSGNYDDFRKTLTNLAKNNPNIGELVENISSYEILRYPQLESLGTVRENKQRFIDFIKFRTYTHIDLFDAIQKRIENFYECQNSESNNTEAPSDVNYNFNQVSTVIQKNDYVTEIVIPVKNNQRSELSASDLDSKEISVSLYELRNTILEKLKLAIPELYGEETPLKNFFYRKCMTDIFSRDRFLLVGAKGTGKTFFYRALSDETFFQNLIQRADLIQRPDVEIKYFVINIISLAKSEKNLEINKRIIVDKHPSLIGNSNDWFFRRFWIVYTWNSIFLSIQKASTSDNILANFKIKSSFDIHEINDEAKTAKRFLDLIQSDDNFSKIEDELKILDSKLIEKNINLMITYDQLDYIIKPSLWYKGISPLISYWHSNPFSNIHPKLFLRSDLFEKLENITNKESLKSSTKFISLEWTREEMFAVLLKLVLEDSRKEFFELMRLYNDYDNTLIEDIELAVDEDNQVSLEKKYLEPLVTTLFGNFVKMGNNNIPTYDWFYNNLCNANRSISLRPFIDLIDGAINNYFDHQSYSNNKYIKPILDPRHYTFAEVRQNSVERHFTDLANEEGNTDLKRIFSYIKQHAPASLRKSFLTDKEFNTLLNNVKNTYPEMKDKVNDDLKKLLIVNGIIYEKYASGGIPSYTFALLYKYYLGLSSKRD
jgi:cellulose biosynthesis protein BcsQ